LTEHLNQQRAEEHRYNDVSEGSMRTKLTERQGINALVDESVGFVRGITTSMEQAVAEMNATTSAVDGAVSALTSGRRTVTRNVCKRDELNEALEEMAASFSPDLTSYHALASAREAVMNGFTMLKASSAFQGTAAATETTARLLSNVVKSGPDEAAKCFADDVVEHSGLVSRVAMALVLLIGGVQLFACALLPGLGAPASFAIGALIGALQSGIAEVAEESAAVKLGGRKPACVSECHLNEPLSSMFNQENNGTSVCMSSCLVSAAKGASLFGLVGYVVGWVADCVGPPGILLICGACIWSAVSMLRRVAQTAKVAFKDNRKAAGQHVLQRIVNAFLSDSEARAKKRR
jgi:hypothetical protein